MTCNDNTVFYLCLSNLSAFLLFVFSEILSSTKFESNGVFQFLSRRIVCLGGRRIKIDISIPPRSSDVSVSDETPLLEEDE